MLDQRFVEVQVSSFEEFLALKDEAGWGLFVGFEDYKCCVFNPKKEGTDYKLQAPVYER